MSMKKLIGIILLIVFQLSSFATNNTKDSLATSKEYFIQAKQELQDMLDGKQPLSYERAIFVIENAYNGNILSYTDFLNEIDLHSKIIFNMLSDDDRISNEKKDLSLFEMARQTPEQRKENYQKALINWTIYKYITDTTILSLNDTTIFFHFPYKYSTSDPMGTTNWANTEVINLLNNGMGNCFALSTLFKIFADRLHSDAHLCTAPSHIYITHKDENGTDYNVELASHSFPGSGTLETLTYTTGDATRNGIALRTLTNQQLVALCLVYLAKGYEHKFGVKDDFMLQCAETTLQYDSLNLNAMLLKAEILENNLIQKHKTVTQLQTDAEFKRYEKLLSKLYTLGYREMPIDMKNLLVKGWTRDTVEFYLHNYLVQNKDETRKASLSWGLFDEEHKYKPIEQYSQTLFDCKTKKIREFVKEKSLYNDYNFDPIVFAWNVDPLTHQFPSMSPYAAFADNPIFNIDKDGKMPEPWIVKMLTEIWGKTDKIKLSDDIYKQMNDRWAQSFDKAGNSTERTATVAVDIQKKDFTLTNIGGSSETEHHSLANLRVDKNKYVMMGSFHTHPYKDGANTAPSGDDIGRMGDENEAFITVQSGKNVYLLMMTTETPNIDKMQIPIANLYAAHREYYRENMYNSKLSEKKNFENEVEYATKQTAKEYKMILFKGKSGGTLKKQDLDKND